MNAHDERITEMSDLLKTWSEAHQEAEQELLKQFARVAGELKALERSIRGRQERYQSELAALRSKLNALADRRVEL